MSVERFERELEDARTRATEAEAEAVAWKDAWVALRQRISDLCEETNGRHAGCSCCEWPDEILPVGSALEGGDDG